MLRVLDNARTRTFAMRPSGRDTNALRTVEIETGVTKHAEGSCLIKMGDTHVLCTASLEERVPPFLKNTGFFFSLMLFFFCLLSSFYV